jgi:hypothetical protein
MSCKTEEFQISDIPNLRGYVAIVTGGTNILASRQLPSLQLPYRQLRHWIRDIPSTGSSGRSRVHRESITGTREPSHRRHEEDVEHSGPSIFEIGLARSRECEDYCCRVHIEGVSTGYPHQQRWSMYFGPFFSMQWLTVLAVK